MGVTCTGNALWRPGTMGARASLAHLMESSTTRTTNCVITYDALHDGALRKLLLELSHRGEDVIVRDNLGRIAAT